MQEEWFSFMYFSSLDKGMVYYNTDYIPQSLRYNNRKYPRYDMYDKILQLLQRNYKFYKNLDQLETPPVSKQVNGLSLFNQKTGKNRFLPCYAIL